MSPPLVPSSEVKLDRAVNSREPPLILVLGKLAF